MHPVPYPNVVRWLANIKRTPNYAKVYETFNGFVASTKGQSYLTI